MLILISLADLGRMGLLLRYVQEAGTYAMNWCENADKPEMQCNGQCHLSEELKSFEHSNEEEGIPGTRTHVEEAGVYLSTFLLNMSHGTLASTEILLQNFMDVLHSSEHLDDIFHPPIIFCSI